MGIDLATWNDFTGAYYMGASTSWEGIWLIVSIAMCSAALWVGSKHEADAYKKLEK